MLCSTDPNDVISPPLAAKTTSNRESLPAIKRHGGKISATITFIPSTEGEEEKDTHYRDRTGDLTLIRRAL